MQASKQTQITRTWLLIFLGWIVYTISYLGKVNYSANITQIIDFYGVTKAQAGIAPTFFFFAYGVGQVFNGLFCKKYNIKWVIFCSLMLSGIINLIIALTSNFHIIKWLWLINGFVLSALWPTIVRLLTECLPRNVLGPSSVVMGTTVAAGTLIIYGLSSIYVAFNKFKLSFYTAAFAIFIVAIIWVLLYQKATVLAKSEDTTKLAQEKVENGTSDKKSSNRPEKVFIFSISILCFYAIGINLIKDGLTSWVPSILKESFSISDSLSILLTLFLPICAIFGNAFSLSMHKKIPDYVNHCAMILLQVQFSFLLSSQA